MTEPILEFARPWLLAAGLASSALAWPLFVLFDRRRERDMGKLFHPRFRARLLSGVSPTLRKVRRCFFVVAVFLLFVAAAGPRKGYEWREVKRRGIDLLFAVDTSRSMLAEDLSPNRLERARMGILDFVGRLNGDRVGLIPFAGSSYALCPLTVDYDAFRESLNALDTDIIPKQGTDIASAIREAERLFDERGTNHRVLVLISDGEDLQGDVFDAAAESAKKGMTIHPVGVGGAEGQPIPVRLEGGGTSFVKDSQGKTVMTKLDEAGLRRIADSTGGLYVPLGKNAEGLQTIYQEKLRLVPQDESGARMEKIPLERFEWPLGAALLLLAVEFLLPERRRRDPAPALPSAGRRRRTPATVPALIAAGLCSLLSPSNARAAEPTGGKVDPRILYNQGTKEYTDGEFAKAASTLRSSLTDADLGLQNKAYYNLGNALYRQGQAALKEKPDEAITLWEEAVTAYDSAASLDKNDTAASHNRDLVRRKLEELKKQKGDNQDQKGDGKDKKDQDKKDGEKGGDQQGDKSDDKQGEKSGEKSGDQQGDKSGEQSGDQQGDKSGEQSGDQQGDKSGEKSGDQQGDKSGEQNGGQQGDKPGEQSGDLQGDKSGEQNGDKQSDKSGEQSGDQQGDKSGEQNGDKQGDKSGEQSGDKQGDKPGEQNGDEQGDEPGEQQGDKSEDGEAGKSSSEKDGEDGEKKASTKEDSAGEKRKSTEMTPEQARQLLRSMSRDERTVVPLPRPNPRGRFLDPNNTTKGKTW